MSASQERHLDILKRQLRVLNYHDGFDISSYDLVQKLVADLVHTTETYQSLKLVSTEQHQEIATFRSKVVNTLSHSVATLSGAPWSMPLYLLCR